MKKVLFSLIAVLLCASVAQAGVVSYFRLRASNLTPASGDTVTFTLNYNGTGSGLGLLLADYNAHLSKPGGTATWNPPSDSTILVPGLTAAGSSTGSITADNVNNVVLIISAGFPYDLSIGATVPVDVWSAKVTVFGAPGDTVHMGLVGQLYAGQGLYVDLGSLTNEISDGSALASLNSAGANVTISGVVPVVPEPVSLTLFGIGLGGMALLRRRR